MIGSFHTTARSALTRLGAVFCALSVAACGHNDRLYPFEAGLVEVKRYGEKVLIAGEDCYRDDGQGIDLHVVASNRDGDARAAYEPNCSLNFTEHFASVMANWNAYAGFAPPADGAPGAPSPKVRALINSDPCLGWEERTAARGDKPVHKLMIYVHGGRVAHPVAVKRAEQRAPHIMCDPYVEERHYPVFFVYETRDVFAYYEEAVWIRDGVKQRRPVIEQVPYKLVADFGAGLFRAPYSLLREAQRARALRLAPTFGGNKDYYNEQLRSQNVFDLYASYPHRHGAKTCEDFASCNVLYPEPGDWGLEGANPNRRATNFRSAAAPFLALPKFAIGTPFINATGPTAWQNIRRRALNTANRPSEFNQRQRLDQEKWLRAQENQRLMQSWDWLYRPTDEDQADYPYGAGAFAKFLTDLELCFYWRNHGLENPAEFARIAPACGKLFSPENKDAYDIEVSFVSHSTGAIVLNNLLPRFPLIETSNIVYMAGAASIRDTVIAIAPLIMLDDTPPVFYNLMLHPKAEALDQYAGGLVPEGSLLEWIDEFLAQSLTVDFKTVGKWRNTREARYLFPEDAHKQIAFRVFPANDRKKDMLSLEEAAARPDCLYFGAPNKENLGANFSDSGFFKRKPERATGRCHPLTHGEFESFAWWRRAFWRGLEPIEPELRNATMRDDANTIFATDRDVVDEIIEGRVE